MKKQDIECMTIQVDRIASYFQSDGEIFRESSLKILITCLNVSIVKAHFSV